MRYSENFQGLFSCQTQVLVASVPSQVALVPILSLLAGLLAHPTRIREAGQVSVRPTAV